MAGPSRDDWIAAAMTLLSRGVSPADMTAAGLCEVMSSPVTRGSLSWHFRDGGLAALRREVISKWLVGREAAVSAAAGHRDPADRLRALREAAAASGPADSAMRRWAASPARPSGRAGRPAGPARARRGDRPGRCRHIRAPHRCPRRSRPQQPRVRGRRGHPGCRVRRLAAAAGWRPGSIRGHAGRAAAGRQPGRPAGRPADRRGGGRGAAGPGRPGPPAGPAQRTARGGAPSRRPGPRPPARSRRRVGRGHQQAPARRAGTGRRGFPAARAAGHRVRHDRIPRLPGRGHPGGRVSLAVRRVPRAGPVRGHRGRQAGTGQPRRADPAARPAAVLRAAMPAGPAVRRLVGRYLASQPGRRAGQVRRAGRPRCVPLGRHHRLVRAVPGFGAGRRPGPGPLPPGSRAGRRGSRARRPGGRRPCTRRSAAGGPRSSLACRPRPRSTPRPSGCSRNGTSPPTTSPACGCGWAGTGGRCLPCVPGPPPSRAASRPPPSSCTRCWRPAGRSRPSQPAGRCAAGSLPNSG